MKSVKWLETASKSFIYFSLACNERMDSVNKSQLAVFIRGVNSKIKMTKKFLDVVSQKDRTTGKDMEKGVIKYMKDHQFDLKYFTGIATDGAPLMTRKKI